MLGAGAADPAAVSSFEMVTFAKKSRILEGFPGVLETPLDSLC
jgi:hypothetical protein